MTALKREQDRILAELDQVNRRIDAHHGEYADARVQADAAAWAGGGTFTAHEAQTPPNDGSGESSNLVRRVEGTRRSSNPHVPAKRLVSAAHRVRRRVEIREAGSQLEDMRGEIAERPEKREVSAGEVEEIVRRHREGEAMKVISEALGLDRRRIRRVLYERGVAAPPVRLTEQQARRAARLYEAGGSLHSVSSQFGISAQTLRRYLVALGVVIRPRVGGRVRQEA